MSTLETACVEPQVGNDTDNPTETGRVGVVVSTNDRRGNTKLRVAAVTALLLCITFVIVDSCTNKRVESTIVHFLEWVEVHPYQGVVAVICVYILCTIMFVPGSILTFGTGYAFGAACQNKVYGVLLASTAVFLGASIGSTCTFLLGRYLFRDCVFRLAASYPMFHAIDRALRSNGLKIMILLRLSPLIPYNALDYVSGVTAIPLRDYVIAMIGLLPGSVMLSFIGASASSLTDKSATGNRALQIATIISGVVFAVAGLYLGSYYAMRELDAILAEQGVEDDPGRLASTPLRSTDSQDDNEEVEQSRGNEPKTTEIC